MSEHARNIAPPAMPLGLRIKASPEYRTFKTQFWDDNPLFRQILGVCSALAVTNLVTNTLVMCVAVTLVTACSSCLYALVRDATPPRTRLLVQMLIIASFVIVVHLFLAAYMFAVSEQIGAYVGLIIRTASCWAAWRPSPPRTGLGWPSWTASARAAATAWC